MDHYLEMDTKDNEYVVEMYEINSLYHNDDDSNDSDDSGNDSDDSSNGNENQLRPPSERIFPLRFWCCSVYVPSTFSTETLKQGFLLERRRQQQRQC